MMSATKNIKRPVVMMKMTISKNLYFAYIFVDLIVIVASFFLGDLWLLNTQVAFASSMLITMASFLSYKSMVKERVNSGDLGDDRDLLDDIEDPHKLYEEEEKEPQKIGFKQGAKNLVSSYKGALSPYRIASYGVLCLAVLFLIRHGYFDGLAFLVGLGVVPISSLAGLWFIEKNKEFA